MIQITLPNKILNLILEETFSLFIFHFIVPKTYTSINDMDDLLSSAYLSVYRRQFSHNVSRKPYFFSISLMQLPLQPYIIFY